MGALGFALGIMLAIASKKFAVQESNISKQILAVLPGINCGACGYPGCDGYAKALEKGAPTDKCIPGKKETEDKIKAILKTQSTDYDQQSENKDQSTYPKQQPMNKNKSTDFKQQSQPKEQTENYEQAK